MSIHKLHNPFSPFHLFFNNVMYEFLDMKYIPKWVEIFHLSFSNFGRRHTIFACNITRQPAIKENGEKNTIKGKYLFRWIFSYLPLKKIWARELVSAFFEFFLIIMEILFCCHIIHRFLLIYGHFCVIPSFLCFLMLSP